MTREKRAGGQGRWSWARTGFDAEGLVGALAAWLTGLLLGAIWGPLFWLGMILAVVILLGTRKQVRTPPDAANLVLSPCDGVVHSIEMVMPPSELRLPTGDRLRLRIASSPATTNPIYAPITGEVTSIILEDPNPSVVLAGNPMTPGLAVAHLKLESVGDAVGLMISTGGFGPRLDVSSEAGDAVRAGRVIGKRRLGGWCDVYLKPGARLLVSPGQSLIGAETVLCRLSAAIVEDELPREEDVVEPQPDEEDLPALPVTAEATPGDPEEESAKLFEKLKRHAEHANGQSGSGEEAS